MIYVDAYRAAVGSFHHTAVQLSLHNNEHSHYTGKKFCQFQNIDFSQNDQYYFLKSFCVSIIFFITTVLATTSVTLILLCGDVESNPGPTTFNGTQSSSNDVDFQICLQESYYQSLVLRPNLAHQVVENARRIGLNLTFEQPTPGNGNCFYHAVVSQIQRREIIAQIPAHLHFTDHDALRVAVVNFVRQNPYYPVFLNYMQAYQVTYPNLTFDQILDRQQQSSTYAIELFIHATAFMLNIPILVTSEKNTNAKPYQLIRCSAGESADASIEISQMLTDEQNGTRFFLRLGSINSDHFQSLIQPSNATMTTPTITSMSVPLFDSTTHNFCTSTATVVNSTSIFSAHTHLLSGQCTKESKKTCNKQSKNVTTTPPVQNLQIPNIVNSPPKKMQCLSSTFPKNAINK